MLTLVSVVFFLASSVHGQGSKEDYERATSLQQRTRNNVFRTRLQPNWIEGENAFWYQVRTGTDASEYVFVNVESGKRQLAFDHQRLAHAISKAADVKASAGQLPIKGLSFDGRSRLRFSVAGSRWTCDLANYEVKALKDGTDEDSHSDSLPCLTTVERSRGQGEETYVLFVNKTKTPVDLFWVDGGGARRKYETIGPGKEHEQHTFGGHVWLATDKDGKPLAVFRATDQHRVAIIDGLTKVRERSRANKTTQKKEQGEELGVVSPDGKWAAYVRRHNVFVRNPESGTERQLSSDGTADDVYLERIRWSPDSQKLVVMQEKAGETRTVYMVESSPKDQLQPKLHSMEYAKPGDKLPVARPRLFEVNSLKQIHISEELFPNAWRISDVRWQPDSKRFTFLYNQRGHQVLRIIVVDAETGETSTLVDEQSDTFIDYAYKRFTEYLDDSHELIWMSERDGWNHLYLYDSRTGDVKNQITKGTWVVRGVERVDKEKRQIYLRASGVYPEQDPYYIHYARIDFDGSNLTFLTSGNGTHKIEHSPNGETYLDLYSRVDMPPVTELRRSSDGSLICELERGDWSELIATGWQPPERFVAKGRDGATNIYGVIYRPTNFDESQRYPVIEKIYAGPHGSFVPKPFAPYRRDQSYAELGFIVVQIDGMGTSNRSKAFHEVCWKNLGDSGFPDRILWMQAAGKKYPQLNLDRVGIFGGSAGGQSTLRALLAHGEFYKVGVADCGCHDNRMDKVWWNELWMGYPIGPHYEEQSNVTQAHRLTGKLLLTVGELDRNVDPASTMQVVNALIKADKDFDFLIVPGAGHGVGESPYANRRRQDFFVRHLMGVEPRH